MKRKAIAAVGPTGARADPTCLAPKPRRTQSAGVLVAEPMKILFRASSPSGVAIDQLAFRGTRRRNSSKKFSKNISRSRDPGAASAAVSATMCLPSGAGS
jgi:hypothetical protein